MTSISFRLILERAKNARSTSTNCRFIKIKSNLVLVSSFSNPSAAQHNFYNNFQLSQVSSELKVFIYKLRKIFPRYTWAVRSYVAWCCRFQSRETAVAGRVSPQVHNFFQRRFEHLTSFLRRQSWCWNCCRIWLSSASEDNHLCRLHSCTWIENSSSRLLVERFSAKQWNWR